MKYELYFGSLASKEMGWEVGKFYSIFVNYFEVQHIMHVKAADIELCPLLISSHSSCVPELHGQHLCDRAEHMATATTQVRHLDSTWAKHCPKELPKSPLNSSHPKTGMERGRTEITVQVLGAEPQKMANQLVLFKDRWATPREWRQQGNSVMGWQPCNTFVPTSSSALHSYQHSHRANWLLATPTSRD